MSIRTRISSVLLTLALVVIGAVVGVVTAPLASAAERDGTCNSGEFCYYFNSGEAGSISDFTDSQDDYGTTQPSCHEFKSAGERSRLLFRFMWILLALGVGMLAMAQR